MSDEKTLVAWLRYKMDEASGFDCWPDYTNYKDAADLIDQQAARIAELEAENDPTPWCHICGAMQKEKCQCHPRAEND